MAKTINLMFDEKDTALQRICALMLWSHRVAASATDIAMGTSLDPNPVGELEVSLQRIQGLALDWLMEIDPRYGSEKQPQMQGSSQAAAQILGGKLNAEND